MIQVAEDYINSCGREATELPTIEGLALELGINDETVGLWGKAHSEFGEVVRDLKLKQKAQLMNDGLYGGKEINTPMAIFLLKVNHDMIEKSAMDFTSGGDKIEAPILYIPAEQD